jgi:hypothetical protein
MSLARRLLAWPLVRVGNWSFRTYVRLMGDGAEARTLIGTLKYLRGYADAHNLDFRAAVVSSRRRGIDDWVHDIDGDTQ